MIEAPNALLLLQLVNFFIAYFILKHILLKPGLKVLRGIDDSDRSIKRDLALLKEEVDLQNALLEDQWLRHCAVLRSRVPSQDKVVFVRPHSEIVVPAVEKSAELQLIVDLKNAVIENISGERQ